MEQKEAKLAIFDFDSTICEIETLDEFAKNSPNHDKIKQITIDGMNGKIDFFESITSRIELLKGTNKSDLEEIYKNFKLTNGAIEIIKYLKEKNYKIIVFSGGFDTVLEYFEPILGIDTYFANILHFNKQNKLSGKLGGEMMFNDSKGKILQRLQKALNISKENTLVVGDGANDISMFKQAGKSVAFCGKSSLNMHADIIISEKNLLKLKKYV